jgi:hypothetical protein
MWIKMAAHDIKMVAGAHSLPVTTDKNKKFELPRR